MDFKLNINGNVKTNQTEVAEALSSYFATIADGIGEREIAGKTINTDFMNHPSVRHIVDHEENQSTFDFEQFILKMLGKH